MMKTDSEHALETAPSNGDVDHDGDLEKQQTPEQMKELVAGKPQPNTTNGDGFATFVKFGAAAIFLASVVGLGVGLAHHFKDTDSSRGNGAANDPPTIPPEQDIQITRLSYFDESILKGYPDEDATEGSGCLNLKEDLYEAVEIMTNVTIDRQAVQKFHYDMWPICAIARGNSRSDCDDIVYYMDMDMDGVGITEDFSPSDGARETVPESAPSSGEDSFGTNNQVHGVDEADQVKSDGTHVFAAYGSQLVIWDALTGDRLSTTDIPTHDDDGYTICSHFDEDSKEKEPPTFPCYQHHFYSWLSGDVSSNPIQISSIIIHEDRLLVVAEAPDLVIMEDEFTITQKVLSGKGRTRLFIYDINPSNIPSDNSALTLVASKDIHGRYQAGRKIGQHAHIVTSSSVDTWYHIDSKLSAWNKEFANLDEDEYRAKAYEMSLDLGRKFVDDLFDELAGIYNDEEGGDNPICTNIAKIALMMKSRENNDSAVHRLPSFTTSVVLQTLTQVYSLDLLQDPLIEFNEGDDKDKIKPMDDIALKPTITVSASGAFFPISSYTSNVYASAEKLIVAGESYVEDSDGTWNEHTIFLVYDFEKNSTRASAIGDVPGSLLNQFSMDHFSDDDTGEDYLRVATTSWAKWGFVEGGSWQQTEDSQSSVFVLNLSGGGTDDGFMTTIGSVSGIGKGERIYAVRFMGKRGYIVTFRQIDPFYTLDLSDHANPVVVGELKIPGFSNYLHPVNDDLILGLGQDADDNGMVNGLQISLFDVSKFDEPIRLQKYVEEGTSSAAQYEHKAFRYLPESKLLILPVSTSRWLDGDTEYFDGFIVYDVDETTDFKKKFSISHMNSDELRDFCWSQDTLPSRSLVFNGHVTTMKGHKVYSHNLETMEYQWDINLDEDRTKETADQCYGWAW